MAIRVSDFEALNCYRHVLRGTFTSNSFENHQINQIYRISFESCTYTNLDPSTSTGITASVLHKQYDYILSYTSTSITWNYSTVSTTILESDLTSGSSVNFTKPNLFVFSAGGTNTFSSINVTSWDGISTGLYKVETGTLTDSTSTYDGIIGYNGGVYFPEEGTTVSATGVTVKNVKVYYGAVVAWLEDCTFSITSGSVTDNQITTSAVFGFRDPSTVSISSTTISRNSAASSTVLLWETGCTATINSNTVISSNTATGATPVFFCFGW